MSRDVAQRRRRLAALVEVAPREGQALIAAFKRDLAACDSRFVCHLAMLFAQLSGRLHQIAALADNPDVLDLALVGKSGLDGLLLVIEETIERAQAN